MAIWTDGEIIGNIVGSFIGVVGAIAALFLSEWWRVRKAKNDIRDNFVRELTYTKEMLKECRRTVTVMIERLGVGAESLYFDFSYTNILSQSIQQAYQVGLLYETLTPKQIARLNDTVNYFGRSDYPIEKYVGDQLERWKKGEMKNEELYQLLVWIKTKSDDGVKLLAEVIQEFDKKERRRILATNKK